MNKLIHGLFILVYVVVVGFLLAPPMISAKDTAVVVGGFLMLLVSIPVVALWVRKVFLKTEEKK